MTICQFFLQGRCRFGQNCRYEHSYNNDDRNGRNTGNTQQLSNAIQQIEEQVISAEKGGQWPLSCFSPVKEGTNIPGWEDISPEEVRWKMYEARAKGTLNQCINEISQLYSNAEKNRNFLKQPTMERVNLIVNVLKGKKDMTTASNPFASSSSTNIFGSAGQPTSPQPQRNVFGGATQSTGNLFGGTTQSSGNIFRASPQLSPTQGNIFGSSAQTTNTQRNIFGGGTSNFPNQNIFGSAGSPQTNQNVFGSPQPANQNIFSGSSPAGGGNVFSGAQNSFSFAQAQPAPQSTFSPTAGVFSNKSPSTPVFGSQNAFFQNTNSPSQPGVFGGGQNENIFKSQSTFGSSGDAFKSQPAGGNVFGRQSQVTNQQRPNAADSSVYSKMEDLSEEDVKSFTAPTFAFGKIPLKPPPQEYCI